MNNKFAYFLLIAGFLAASFFASLDPLEMQWVPYAFSIGSALIGLYMIKKIEHDQIRDPNTLEANRTHIHSSLGNILNNIEKLNSDKDNIPTYEMRFQIDKLFRDDIDRFVEARESMKHIYCLQDYANVMSAFATGERYLNRVWSASTDGYVDEVSNYVEKAALQFKEAKKILDSVALKNA